ncbi:hypothetical protein AWZ03_010829 [Drosophila navojoa]|uniref:Phenoloxidase-activating factor 2 n=1 Tax=Drosophila navojoa TaxID=7232 RepID=A0A484B4J6_DRONA|nr:phenoloxidase-activating factor 2-like [Drosophila navojoa]TDG42751.1 hypothetical protein AWZ03_010829 [Drosophila navojoa]
MEYLSTFTACLLLLAGTRQGTAQNALHVQATQCEPPRQCTPRHLCDSSSTTIADGRALIDFRSYDFSGRNEGCNYFQKCCAPADVRTAVPEREYVPGLCGMRNLKGLSITILNGQHSESQFGEFPWMVAILIHDSLNNFKSMGGGSLISPRVVLTTAHIFQEGMNEIVVARAGEWDNRYTYEALKHQDRLVQEIITHPDFDNMTGFFDLALLILSPPFKLDKHIGTICLPSPAAIFDSSRCTVTGWGKRGYSDKDYPNILKNIELPFVERNKCENQLRYNTRLGRYFELHESFVCAGGERGRDACFGDGGAPLVCPITKGSARYQLAGMVSWGLGCGAENVPGVYTNVQMMMPWITEQLSLANQE